MGADYPTGWWGTDLGEYRPCVSTYELYPQRSLPSLDSIRFSGDFGWLSGDLAEEPTQPADPQSLRDLRAATAELGLRLPVAFQRFMADERLQSSVPSCTGCYWDLSRCPVPDPVHPGAYLIRFLRDQQDCLRWYLQLGPDATQAVLATPIDFDDEQVGQVPVERIIADTHRCAPDFEQFVYRFWVENTLWFALNAEQVGLNQLPEELSAYLAGYATAA